MKKIEQQNQKKYYSLLDLTKSIESVIKKTYKHSYWVKAEIAKLNYYPKSGHCYPDLVEKENGVVLAQIRATIWAGQFISINNKFMSITNEPLSDGMMVLFRTTVNFHPVYGLGLQISDIEPSFTLGEMAKEKLVSIEKLKKENIFNNNKLLQPSILLQRIAVISVETSKGYHDFVKIINNNDWNYSFFHMLFPALLQGSGAIKSIIEQLNQIKKAKNHFDVVVIIRGGGGDVGLSSYDNYNLAKAVALFPLPIITGIGHATNETVVEMVAFKNKITPTDVGYYLIQKFHNYSVRIQNAQSLLTQRLKQITSNEKLRLKHTTASFKNAAQELINNYQKNFSLLSNTFSRTATSYIVNTKIEFAGMVSALLQKPKGIIFRKENSILLLQKQLNTSVKANILQNDVKISSLTEKLRLLDPANVLKRGYSITTFNGKVITSASNININDIVETQTHSGHFMSEVKSVKNN